jgi:hypothetical protein
VRRRSRRSRGRAGSRRRWRGAAGVVERAGGRVEEGGERGPVAGGEHHGVVGSFDAVGEARARGVEGRDARHDLDLTPADPGDGADVEERDARVPADLGHRPVGELGEAERLDASERQEADEPGDGVGDAQRQDAQRDAPGEDRQPEEIAGDDVDRAANRHARPRAVLGEVDGDLAAGVAESDDQHALAHPFGAVSVLELCRTLPPKLSSPGQLGRCGARV